MGSFVRLLAIAVSAVIGLSLLLFAIDQSSEGRDTQIRSIQGQSGQQAPSLHEVDTANPTPEAERIREKEHSSLRETIDDANDVLVSPFTGFVDNDNIWIERVVPALIGLLLFGLGGLMLANWLPENRPEHQDWRQTHAS